jgi:hypothetical protein
MQTVIHNKMTGLSDRDIGEEAIDILRSCHSNQSAANFDRLKSVLPPEMLVNVKCGSRIVTNTYDFNELTNGAPEERAAKRDEVLSELELHDRKGAAKKRRRIEADRTKPERFVVFVVIFMQQF